MTGAKVYRENYLFNSPCQDHTVQSLGHCPQVSMLQNSLQFCMDLIANVYPQASGLLPYQFPLFLSLYSIRSTHSSGLPTPVGRQVHFNPEEAPFFPEVR